MSQKWRRRVKTILNRFKKMIFKTQCLMSVLVLSRVGGEAARTSFVSGLNQWSCGLNICPTLGSYEVDQGTGMCVFFRVGVGVCVFFFGRGW